MNLPSLMILILWGGFIHRSASASPSDQRYNVGDRVPLLVNKIGPFSNPSETYHYYDLPFCSPDPLIQKTESLGEVLGGDRLTNALYELKFRVDKTEDTLCKKKLGVNDVAKFREAVINDFYFQMYYDDLPFWGFIGKIEDGSLGLDEKGGPKYYLFKHVQFGVLYNGNQVIEIHALGDPNRVVDITEDAEINVEFTYSVIWNVTSAQFVNRMDKYSKASYLPIHQQIRRMSFINSTAIILLLIGLLSVLLMRRLKNDMKKYSSGDEEENKEVGWKNIHGDVFRRPRNMTLFSAVLGVGTQLLTMVCLLFILSFVGVLYPFNRGALSTSLVLVYVITSVIAGYSSASFHSQFAENGWERSVLLAGFLYVGPLFVMVSGLNTVAISYGATAALPFGTIMVILLVYTLVAIPLLAVGGVVGYRFRSEFQAPSATKRYPRDIPSLSWYRKTPCQMFIAGLLSFTSIVLELHHFYATLWGFKVYTLPSILFITFIVLVILTAILSVGLTYIQLSAEDHEWWWRSVLCGGSTAICMFVYCIYLYGRSSMHGFLQLSFFVGYNACMCYAVFLILGTISFRVSLVFVCHIYQAVKGE